MASDPAHIRDDLLGRLKGIYDDLKRVWEAQSELDCREEQLRRERDKYEGSIRLIEDEYQLEPGRIEPLSYVRSRARSEARQRKRAQVPRTAADVVDAVLRRASAALSAEEILDRVLASENPGVLSDVAEVRTVLSRYRERYGWVKSKGTRPARWRRSSRRRS